VTYQECETEHHKWVVSTLSYLGDQRIIGLEVKYPDWDFMCFSSLPPNCETEV